MKQYLNEQQTTKLIELGFEKPRLLYFGNNTIGHYAYTIGELIEMLPKTIEEEIWWGGEKGKIGVWGLVINTLGVEYLWEVSYEREYSCAIYSDANTELIDALFAVVVKLKEEGVV